MVAAPFEQLLEPAPLATYTVIQRATITGAVGGSLGSPTGAGNTLFVYIISNSATQPTVTLSGGTGAVLTCGYWSAGHGSNWSGIFYCLNTPAGITGYTTSGIYGSSYREVSGIASNPIVVWNFGGNATAGTSFSVPVPGATSSGDFVTGLLDYSANNGGNPYTDGWVDQAIATNFGQTSYTTGTTAATGTMASSAYDSCSLCFKQANQVPGDPAINWAIVGNPTSRNVTSGQGSLTVTVANAGDLLVLYTKVAINTNFLTNVTGGGTTWTQSLTGFTDTNTSPHVQQCWTAKSVNTGSVTLTLTFSAGIGTTGVETVFAEFDAGAGSFSYTTDLTSTRNNGSGAFITWPALAPSSSAGELFIGFGRAISSGPFRTPSGPAVAYTTVATDLFLYAFNMVSSFQPQVWSNTAGFSYCSGLLIKANPLTIDASSASATAASATLGAGMTAVGTAPSVSSAGGSLLQTMAVAGSSPVAAVASGGMKQTMLITASAVSASSASASISDKGALTGSAASSSAANGYLTPIVIVGNSPTVSAAAGVVVAILKTSASSASLSSATGTMGGAGVIAGASATASSAVGAVTARLAASGSSTTVSSAAGTMATALVIGGSAATVSHANGALALLASVVGSAAAASAASGAVVLNAVVSGLAPNASSATGTIGSAPPMDGSARAVSVASGKLLLEEIVTGSSSTPSSAFGTVAASLAIAGSAASYSGATGNLGGAALLAGSSASASAASGAVTSTLAIAGSAVSASTATGTATATLALDGAASTVSSAAGTISGLAALAGSAASDSLAAGWLVGVLEIDGLSITVSGGDGTVLPPYIAGLLPPTITGIVTVEPGPAVLVSVESTEALVLVSSVSASVSTVAATGTVFVSNTVRAEVT
jgi:hypothetical protein